MTIWHRTSKYGSASNQTGEEMDKITASLLKEFTQENGYTGREEDKQFELFSTFITVSRFHSETFNIDELVIGSGGDTSIDAIAIIVNGCIVGEVEQIEELVTQNGYLDVQFVFVQAERSSNFDGSKIGETGYGVEDFFKDKPKLPRNKFVKKAAQVMNAIYDKSSLFTKANPACHIYYVTTGKWVGDPHLTGRKDGVVDSLKNTKLFSDVEFTPIDAEEIRKLWRETKNSISRTFVLDRKSSLPEIKDVDVAYIGSLSALKFLEIITDIDGSIKKSLFYDNIRDYQGDNKVNAEIKGTLSSEEMRARFSLMNNGVTIIAKGLRNTGDRFTIEDFQIVNGCQTSHVLYENKHLLDDTVFVPVRIISTQNPEIISSIIRATNRQTVVKDVQLNALTEFNKKLEDFFRSYDNGRRLYYERRPKQYASTNVEKTRIVTTDNLIRAYISFFGEEPHRVTKGFSEVLKGIGTTFFADNHVMEPYYASAYALYRLESLFRSEELDSKFKPARFQILLAFRLIINPTAAPRSGSNEMKKFTQQYLDALWDKPKAATAFKTAADGVEEIVGDIITSGEVRTKPVTDAIMKKFRPVVSKK
jgi:AIPR protein